MSTRLVALAWPLQIPEVPKLILLALADQASDHGICVPAPHSLTRRCGLDAKTVGAWVKWLGEHEFIRPSAGLVLSEGNMPVYQLVEEKLDPNYQPPIAQAGSRAPSTILLPIVGNAEGPKEVPIEGELLSELQTAFPNINIAAELLLMRAYFIANPEKRKTKRGLSKAIYFWMSRVQNSGGRVPATQAPRGVSDVAAANQQALAAAKEQREKAHA